MRLLRTSLLLTFPMLCLTCTQSGKPSTFFQPAGFDADSRVSSLERQIGYMRSKLGFATYEFEFATPEDKKLIATFKAELNGDLVPELSGIYHIPPTGSNPNKKGLISVNFFFPKYQTPQFPTWELNLSSSGVGHGWTMKCPFTLTETRARSTDVSNSGLGMLEDEKEHEVWEYRISPVEANKSAESEFKYRLTIKLEKVGEGEDLQKIRREDFR